MAGGLALATVLPSPAVAEPARWDPASPADMSPAAARALDRGLLGHWGFERHEGGRAVDRISGVAGRIASPFRRPERARGPVGRALRFDGYSTWVTADVPPDAGPIGSLSVSAWVAAAAYPTANAGLVSRYVFPSAGWFLGVDPWGRWYFAASIRGEWHTAWAPEPLPLGRWAHLAGTFEAGRGLTLHLDGVRVATQATPPGRIRPAHGEELTIGRDAHGGTVAGLFPTGVFGGLIDEVRIYDRALHERDVAALHRIATVPPKPPLEVPARRFERDAHRPRFHPMPPAAWTNEPHGLVRHEGRWHLFHQANPSGPYWAHMHWGHLSSPDLVEWHPEPPALRPGEGFDAVGAWSGGVVIDGQQPAILYTGVDGARAAIGLARGTDGMAGWVREPSGPVILASPEGFLDFRDPFAWRDGERWYMLAGSGVPGAGGTALLYRSDDLVGWELLGPLMVGDSATSGVFWEMPVLLPVGPDRHVLLVTTVEDGARARGLYWIGRWAEERFVPDDPVPREQELFPGLLSPTVGLDGDRLVAIGVVPEERGSEAQLEAGWANVLGLPRVLRLCGDEKSLCQGPLPELERLRGDGRHLRDVPLDRWGVAGLAGVHAEIVAEIDPGAAREVGIAVREAADGRERTVLHYDVAASTLTLDRSGSSLDPAVARDIRSAPLDRPPGAPVRLHVFLDGSVLDVFVDEQHAFSTRIYPTRADAVRIRPYALGSGATLRSLDLYELDARETAPPVAHAASRGEPLPPRTGTRP
jgi:sucrose-6-phosphate hydrolase SacC (GH32 family)